MAVVHGAEKVLHLLLATAFECAMEGLAAGVSALVPSHGGRVGEDFLTSRTLEGLSTCHACICRYVRMHI